MLGLLLIYWIGKKFYVLAENHNRSPWGFAILAVVVYYISQFVFGLILVVINPETFENMDNGMEMGFNLLGVLVGLGIWYLLFLYLERKWENEEETYEDSDDKEIESIGQQN